MTGRLPISTAGRSLHVGSRLEGADRPGRTASAVSKGHEFVEGGLEGKVCGCSRRQANAHEGGRGK